MKQEYTHEQVRAINMIFEIDTLLKCNYIRADDAVANHADHLYNFIDGKITAYRNVVRMILEEYDLTEEDVEGFKKCYQ